MFLDLGTRLPLDVEELLMPLLDACTDAYVVRARIKVRQDGMKACGLCACPRSDLTRNVTERQIHVSYAGRQSRYISISYNPRSPARHAHELMFSKLPCFSVALNGRCLAWILVYSSHTKHNCRLGADGEAVLARG